MARFYQSRTLPDGSLNPKYRRGGAHSGPSGYASKFVSAAFVAWDGEGVTVKDGSPDGSHRYIMLANSEGHAIEDRSANGLSTRDCLQLLTDIGERTRKHIHVMFGASYDVNMMLTDCTTDQIRRIWAGQWVVIAGRYVVNYRPRKSFSVRVIGNKRKRITLWDVFGFFQSSFVDALKKYLPHYPETNVIAQRKAERSAFDASDFDGILRYCVSECNALVALMDQLRQYLMVAGLSVQRWDGAGACAAALLKRQGVLAHKSQSVLPIVAHAAQCAYAGGRIETLKYGHAPNARIHHYDINSAYPAAMRSCPSLASGQWRELPRAGLRQLRKQISNVSRFSLCHVAWAFDDGAIVYPFFWRAHDSSIYYPRQGNGWHWLPEVEAAYAAMDAGAISGRIEVTAVLEYVTDAAAPFQWIDPLFEQRAEWKRQGIGAEKVLKLAINSLYGKTAQHVGGSDGQPPRYHQLEWAGFITASTRAALYRAVLPAISGSHRRTPQAIMLSTDGVYSLVPLDLPCGANLGEWSYEQHDGITVVQSGVYWTYNDGRAKSFCRGFDKGSLDCTSIVRAWERGDETYDATLSRFITMGSALASDATFRDNWQKWRTAPRSLALSPNGTKRCDPKRWTTRRNPAHGLLDTFPSMPAAQVVGQGLASAPYPLPWVTDVRETSFFDGVFSAPTSIVETEAYDSIL